MTIIRFSDNLGPPESYVRFLAEMKAFVAKRGLCWEIEIQEDGSIRKEHDWDLRVLTGGHRKYSVGLKSFGVDQDVIRRATERGIGQQRLAAGLVLSSNCQDVIKGFVALGALALHTEVSTRDRAAVLRQLLSMISCEPWDISSEHCALFSAMYPDKAIRAMPRILTVFNSRLLSRNVPLAVVLDKSIGSSILASLEERQHSEKLPPLKALYELTRIIFHEKPRSHLDEMLF